MRRMGVRGWVWLMGLLIPGLLVAATTGKIAGRVVDAETGEPLPFVNVIVEGTVLGAATDEQGNYFILNVPPGTYTVVASMIGYRDAKVENVHVSAGFTTTVNFRLELTVLATQEVVITAERPIVQRDVTSSTRFITSQEIAQMPVTDFEDIVALQAGAVETGLGLSAGLHIRGGRTNEVVYLVDGINVNDPVRNQPGIQLANQAIQEMLIVTGGFNAEFGQAMSGIVNIVTREGTPKLGGSVEYETDRPLIPIDTALTAGKRYGFGHDRVNLSLGGPIPGLKRGTFFVSGEFLEHEDRLPHNDESRQSGTGKLTWQPTGSIKTTLSGNFSQSRYHRYAHGRSRGDWLRTGPLFTRDNYQLNLMLNHTLSKSTFYTLNIGTFHTHFGAKAWDGQHYNDWKEIGRMMLPWAGSAIAKGWYDQEWRTWYYYDTTKKALTDSCLVPPEVLGRYPVGTMKRMLNDLGFSDDEIRRLKLDRYLEDPIAAAVWFWYYDSLGYGRMEGGRWRWSGETRGEQLENALEALNNLYYEVNTWRLRVENGDTVGLEYNLFNAARYIQQVREYMRADTIKNDSLRRAVKDSLLKRFEPSGNMYYIRYNRDEFRRFAYHPWPIWHDRQTTKHTIDFDLTSQLGSHQVKLGGELYHHDLKLTDLQFVNPNPYLDHYHKEPIIAAAYIQDKIEHEDLTVNAGVRFDYFHPRSEFYIKLDSLDAGKDQAKPKWQLSPRLGISYSVGERSVMYASYGHFFQPVDLGDIYQNLEADITQGIPLLGNPNLPPQKTVAYEVGLRHAFTPDMAGEVTAYYKDVENLLATRQITTIYDRKLAQYNIYVLEDFAVVKGIDLTLMRRASQFLSGSISYSYLDAKGTGSSGREFYYRYRDFVDILPKREYPLEFDVTHSLKANVNLYLPSGFGPSLFGFKPLSDLNTNLQYNLSSGPPYTPTDRKGTPLEPGSKRLPPTQTLDMRMEKNLKLGGMKYGLFLDVRNLFDTRNARNVYTFTGKPDDDGGRPRWDPAYYGVAERGYEAAWQRYLADVRNWERYVANPANFGAPRTIKVGLMTSF